jgi:uncharacterized protein (TIGR00255 family)
MRSMTGFACAEKQSGVTSVFVEIKSYNNRFLELCVNLNSQLSSLEPRIRRIINERCKRGKIEVNIREKKENSHFSVCINTEAVRAYNTAVTKIKSLLPSDIYAGEKIPLETLLKLDGIIEIEKENEDESDAWKNIKDVFFEAFEKFETERNREGCNTKENILSYITILEKSRDKIASFLPRIEQSIKDNIKLRLAEFTVDVDENRILAETALLMMKYTIAEEISRLSSHLSGFRTEIDRNDSSGKKLDFISQEINREINTIGSKTPFIEVSRVVIDMKDAVENIREQLRNVE